MKKADVEAALRTRFSGKEVGLFRRGRKKRRIAVDDAGIA
jgi:hypothetical protein